MYTYRFQESGEWVTRRNKAVIVLTLVDNVFNEPNNNNETSSEQPLG
jgi:hypothetical protein